MAQSTPIQDATRKETRARRIKRELDWRVKVARAFFWLVVTSSISVIFLLLLITLGEYARLL